MENAIIEAILSRSSIRAYFDTPLSEAELSTLKKAALASPTAMNRQNQRFVFVTNKERIAEINSAVIDGILASGNAEFAERIRSRGGQTLYSPAVFIGIFSAPGHYAGVDAGIAVENLALAAKSMDLDSVILGMPSAAFGGEKGRLLAASLGVPEGFDFTIGISIGHRAMDKTPHEYDESHIIEVK